MPIFSANCVDFVSRSVEQTRRLGVRLGSLARAGDVYCLSGDLGAGKTTFVQGFAKGWGSRDQVSSPTFVLINQYSRTDGNLLHHLDAYRIDSLEEAADLDLDEYLTTGTLIVEWAERIRATLPDDYLEINFTWVGEDQRNLVMTPYGSRYEKLMEDFKRLAFGG